MVHFGGSRVACFIVCISSVLAESIIVAALELALSGTKDNNDHVPIQSSDHCISPHDPNFLLEPTFLSDWHITELHNPQYFHPYDTLDQLVEDTALEVMKTPDDAGSFSFEEAACEFRPIMFSRHFPHAYVFSFFIVCLYFRNFRFFDTHCHTFRFDPHFNLDISLKTQRI